VYIFCHTQIIFFKLNKFLAQSFHLSMFSLFSSHRHRSRISVVIDIPKTANEKIYSFRLLRYTNKCPVLNVKNMYFYTRNDCFLKVRKVSWICQIQIMAITFSRLKPVWLLYLELTYTISVNNQKETLQPWSCFNKELTRMAHYITSIQLLISRKYGLKHYCKKTGFVFNIELDEKTMISD
jgi:hypothetical protein